MLPTLPLTQSELCFFGAVRRNADILHETLLALERPLRQIDSRLRKMVRETIAILPRTYQDGYPADPLSVLGLSHPEHVEPYEDQQRPTQRVLCSR